MRAASVCVSVASEGMTVSGRPDSPPGASPRGEGDGDLGGGRGRLGRRHTGCLHVSGAEWDAAALSGPPGAWRPGPAPWRACATPAVVLIRLILFRGAAARGFAAPQSDGISG